MEKSGLKINVLSIPPRLLAPAYSCKKLLSNFFDTLIKMPRGYCNFRLIFWRRIFDNLFENQFAGGHMIHRCEMSRTFEPIPRDDHNDGV